MSDLGSRPATEADAADIARIYNEGIAELIGEAATVTPEDAAG